MNFNFCIGYFILLSFIVNVKLEPVTEGEQSTLSDKIRPYAFECLKNHSLSFSELYSFKRKIVPDGENAACFIACVLKKIGVIDEKGMVSPDDARKQAEQLFNGNEEQIKDFSELLQICSEANDEKLPDSDHEDCDRAKLVYQCLIKNGPKYGFNLDF